MIKNFSILLAFFLLTEIALGYWIFSKDSKIETGRYDSSIIRAAQSLDKILFDGAIFNSNLPALHPDTYIEPCQTVNFSTPSAPTINTQGAFEYQLQFHESNLNDIIKNRDKNYIILMLGNSELHGGCCHEGLKISSELQEKLRNYFDMNNLYVVNAGGPGLLLNDEIKIYNELKKRRGAIINIIDIHVEPPLKDHIIYNISKAGLLALTRTLAKDLAPKIRVNGVSPGAIMWPENESSNNKKLDILSKIPMKSTGEPADIAKTIYFLLEQSPYITGQNINVDGGRRLNM